MKIRTWEKWYWGIIFCLIILSLIGYSNDPTKFTIKLGNGPERIMTWKEMIIFTLVFYVGFLGLIWLIVRYFVNKGKGSRERERERDKK